MVSTMWKRQALSMWLSVFAVSLAVSFRAAAASTPISWLVPPRAVTFASLNTSVLAARAWPLALPSSPAPRTWVQTSTCCGYGVFTPAAVAAASSLYGLFDEACLPDAWPVLAEWGYEFMDDSSGTFPVCGNLSLAAHGRAPATRAEAKEWLGLYWACRAADTRAQANATVDVDIVSEVGHFFFAGMSGTFATPGSGIVIPGAEVGENINSIQLHLAASRGAARQGGTPFLIDFSSWLAGYITDYSSPGFWGAASSPVGGHSVSLVRRTYFAAFLAGAGALVAEAGAVNFFEGDTPPFELSPLGRVGAEVFAFTRGAPGGAPSDPEAVRGIPYVPNALVSASSFGAGIPWFYIGLAWGTFPLSPAELRLNAFLDALWPGSFTVMNEFHTPLSEAHYLVASPFGDSVDLLLPAPSLTAQLLAGGYRVVVFAGLDADMTQDLALEVTEYVRGGGCAIVSAPDIAVAAAAGWLSPAFLGVALAPGPPVLVHATRVTDAQTGWSALAAISHAPFCVRDDANNAFCAWGVWIIKGG